MSLQEAKQQINDAASFMDIAKVFQSLFGISIPGQEPPVVPDAYKDETGEYGLQAKGIKAREKLNAACKEVLDRVKDPKDLTRADIEVLRQYSGKGGLAEGSQYEYYTPQHVAEGCWDTLSAQGFTAGNVLDPSTGAGMFEATKNRAAIITGCDLDATSSRIAQLLHPEELIENKPFEQLAVETPDNTFDAVITNVPFGSARGKSQHLDPDYKSEKKIERYFILRALHKLKPGGLAVFICPINIVGAKGDAGFAKWRTAVSKIAEFMGAHKLPSKTFKDQGTDTVVDVVVFRKHPESLLSRIDSIPFDTLKAANVVWDEFIQGRYWQGEGKRFIMGNYIPKVEGDRWSRETVDGDIDNAGLKAKLAAKFDSRIDWTLLEDSEPVQRVYAEGDRKIMNGSEYEFTHDQWVKIVSSDKSTPIDKQKYGAATVEELRSIMQDPRACMSLTAQQAFSAWKTYPNLMSPLAAQAIEFAMRQPKIEFQDQLWRGSLIGGMIGRYQAQITEGENNEDERHSLQELVAQEVMKYGHPANNKGLSVIGDDARMYGVFKNSLDVKGNYSDLLAGTMDGSGKNLQFDPTNLQSIVEYLFIREGMTTITLEDVQAMYTGGKNITTLGDLAECEEIALTTDGLVVPVSRYCAGDVYPKIDAMNHAIALEVDPRIVTAYQRQIETIGRKLKITELHEIDFTLQQKWIPREMMRDYLKDTGYEARYGTYQKVKRVDALSGVESDVDEFVEDYSSPFGEWQVAGLSGRGYNKAVDFEKKLGGFPLNLQKHLNGKSILDHVEKDDTGTRNDYMAKQKALETGLTDYISGHPDIETVLASYNRKMNGYIPFDYDESDLGLKGISGQIKLHTYQNAAVRRLSEEGSGILAHNVGLGKSFQALALAKYNTQMGRSKRTCIVVPSAVLSNWYHEAKMLYGNMDHALFVGIKPVIGDDGTVQQENILDEAGQPKTGKDGKPLMQDVLKSENDAEAVWNAMWQIPGSSQSLIIMTKDRFGQIPLKKESKDAYSELMAADLKNSAAKLAEAAKMKKKGGYAGAVEDERNEGKFSNDGTKKRGDFPFFEDMGITDVIVDEAHEFKNGTAASGAYDQRYYLPNTAPSNRAIDMAMKLHHLKNSNNGRGAYFLTATPITNSLNEVYTMLNHVAPRNEFTDRGIYTLDDFLATFGEFENVDKILASGDTNSGLGLTGFKNMDGLRDLFFKYVNMKDATQVEELRNAMPESEKLTDECELNSEQRTVYAALVKEYEEKKRPLFAIMRDMDKITTDPDLFYNRMTWHFPLSKKAAVEAMLKDLPASVKAKGKAEPGDADYDSDKDEDQQKIVEKQIQLSDMLKTEVQGDTFIVVVHAGYEEQILGALSKFKISEDEVSHPISAKYAKLIENCKKQMEINGKQIIFSEEKAQHKKIVRLLVHQIPALRNKVGIINATEAAGNKLQQISDAYNTGVLVYIIANRKAEVGVNLQKGTTAIHHMTYPWTKASLTQREGRGVRQGNTAKKVTIYYYQAKGTIDMMRLDLIEHKGALIDDIAQGQGNRSANGEADPAMAALMFAANPEEARRKIQEQLAEKAKAEADRLKSSLLNQFGAYSANMQALSNLEVQRESDRKSLTDKIDGLKKSVENLKHQALGYIEGSESRKSLSVRVQRDVETLTKREAELVNLDIKYDQKKISLEGNIKRASSTLKSAAKNGTLPVDVALLDHPEDVLVAADGISIVSKGDMYEVKRYDGAASCIIKVVSVANGLTQNGVMIPYKGFAFTQLTGKSANSYSSNLPQRMNTDGNSMVTLSRFLDKSSSEPMPTRCSYSEKEIEIQQKLAQPFTDYAKLKELDKDFFKEYYSKMSFSGMYGFVGRDSNGTVGLHENMTEGVTVVFPDTLDENLRKAVGAAALVQKRSDSGVGYWSKNTLRTFFGANWEAAIAEYGTKATQAETLKFMQEKWQQELSGRNQTEKEYAAQITSFSSTQDSLFRDMISQAKALGDNTEEIRAWAIEGRSTIEARLSGFREEIRADQDKAKLDALRNHPDFKEIPESIKSAFDRLNIEVKVNTCDMVMPGFKGGHGTPVAAFQKYYMQDRNGKQGKLDRMKDQIKGQFDAKYFADAGGEFNGSWWHVPATTDLARIYELLS